MPYEVLRTPQVATALERMSTRERRSYDAARDLTRAWRMFTAYPDEQRIVIVALDEHDRDHNPAAELAQVLPGLATIGWRRSDKPPCCEEADKPL